MHAVGAAERDLQLGKLTNSMTDSWLVQKYDASQQGLGTKS
jgi:hypothetical protein